MMKFPGDPYFKYLALKQYGPPPDQEQQALLISGLPSALKIIIRSYGNPTVIRLGTCILNNLTSPEARGSFGTVAQEEAINKTTPLNKTVINTDLIEVTSFYYFPFFFYFISQSTTTISKNSSMLNIPFSTSYRITASC
ncbi:MAG: hypothetical protein ACXWMO_04330 [Syntrophales bacterium]